MDAKLGQRKKKQLAWHWEAFKFSRDWPAGVTLSVTSAQFSYSKVLREKLLTCINFYFSFFFFQRVPCSGENCWYEGNNISCKYFFCWNIFLYFLVFIRILVIIWKYCFRIPTTCVNKNNYGTDMSNVIINDLERTSTWCQLKIKIVNMDTSNCLYHS